MKSTDKTTLEELLRANEGKVSFRRSAPRFAGKPEAGLLRPLGKGFLKGVLVLSTFASTVLTVVFFYWVNNFGSTISKVDEVKEFLPHLTGAQEYEELVRIVEGVESFRWLYQNSLSIFTVMTVLDFALLYFCLKAFRR